MERSEGIIATMIRIVKSMDRSNANLMRSIGDYESSDSFVEAAPMAPTSLPASWPARNRVRPRRRSFNERPALPSSWSPLAARPVAALCLV